MAASNSNAFSPARATTTVQSRPTYAQVDAESAVAEQLKHTVYPSEPVETQVSLGRPLVADDPRKRSRGAGVRLVDLGSDREYASRPYRLIEAKRTMNPGRMDAALGSLLYEQALAARSWQIPQRDLHPVAVFSGSAFDPLSPPETVRTWARVADRAGIDVWVGTEGEFVRLNDTARQARSLASDSS